MRGTGRRQQHRAGDTPARERLLRTGSPGSLSDRYRPGDGCRSPCSGMVGHRQLERHRKVVSGHRAPGSVLSPTVVTPGWGSTTGAAPSLLCRQVAFKVPVLLLPWVPNTRSQPSETCFCSHFSPLVSAELFSSDNHFRKLKNEQHGLQRAYSLQYCPKLSEQKSDPNSRARGGNDCQMRRQMTMHYHSLLGVVCVLPSCFSLFWGLICMVPLAVPSRPFQLSLRS